MFGAIIHTAFWPLLALIGIPAGLLGGFFAGMWYGSKGHSGLGAAVVGLGIASALCWPGRALANQDLNSMMSTLGGQVSGDMNGAVQAFAPYIMNVAMLIVGLLLLAGIAFAIARKVF